MADSATVRLLGNRAAVVRFSGARPLVRGVFDHFASAMQLGGRSRWSVGGRPWESAPGSMSVKVPGEVSIEHAREGTLAMQVIAFDARFIDEARTVLGGRTGGASMRPVDADDPRARPLRRLHAYACREQIDDDVSGLTCEAVTALVELAWPAGSTHQVSYRAEVVRARAMLDDRLTESVTLDELATHARVDKFRLCRTFREQVGMPPHAYVTHRRVALAQTLLARGCSPAETALQVGFYDQSLLSRHFTRILRITPGVFARAVTAGGRATHGRRRSP